MFRLSTAKSLVPDRLQSSHENIGVIACHRIIVSVRKPSISPGSSPLMFAPPLPDPCVEAYARAVSQAAPRAGKVSPATALARQRSPAQLKLETLEKDHERLLRDIARKRASRDSTERVARDAASALEGRASPIRSALLAASIELRGIFAALLGEDSRLRRRDKGRVRRVYLQLFPELGGRDDISAAGGRESSADGERDPHDPGSSARDPRRSGAAADDAREAGYSASKPDGQRASVLRNIFRRLAIALHPDKVRDVAECAALTAIMKEVTCAYESGDLARLVELERTWLADLPIAERDEG